MRALKIPSDRLGIVEGNFWQLLDGDEVVLDLIALPAVVTEEPAVLIALEAIRDEPEQVVAATAISKDAIWRRATDEEAELMEAALQSQPVRLRRIYEGATFISTTDELYGVLEAALVQLFGAERAAELLEPTG